MSSLKNSHMVALHLLIDESLFGLNNFQNTVPFAI